MKKLLSLLLALMMVLSLAACGAKEVNDTPDADVSAGPAPTEQDDGTVLAGPINGRDTGGMVQVPVAPVDTEEPVSDEDVELPPEAVPVVFDDDGNAVGWTGILMDEPEVKTRYFDEDGNEIFIIEGTSDSEGITIIPDGAPDVGGGVAGWSGVRTDGTNLGDASRVIQGTP